MTLIRRVNALKSKCMTTVSINAQAVQKEINPEKARKIVGKKILTLLNQEAHGHFQK